MSQNSVEDTHPYYDYFFPLTQDPLKYSAIFLAIVHLLFLELELVPHEITVPGLSHVYAVTVDAGWSIPRVCMAESMNIPT